MRWQPVGLHHCNCIQEITALHPSQPLPLSLWPYETHHPLNQFFITWIWLGHLSTQPDNDNASFKPVTQCMSGNGFNFMSAKTNGTLCPVAFGSWQTRGNKKHLHSYLGEIFAGDWAMGKCRHMLFVHCFIWITDCYTAHFFLSYNGSNQAIQRLQMHIMGWDVDIMHCTNNYLVDADYWSRLNTDLRYDPTFKDYIWLVTTLWSPLSSPTELPMQPLNMLCYHGPHIKHPANPAWKTSNISNRWLSPS